MSLEDSNNLKKRSGIESVFNVLKNIYHLEHSSHRSVVGFMLNTVCSVCSLALRTFKSKKNPFKKLFFFLN